MSKQTDPKLDMFFFLQNLSLRQLHKIVHDHPEIFTYPPSALKYEVCRQIQDKTYWKDGKPYFNNGRVLKRSKKCCIL